MDRVVARRSVRTVLTTAMLLGVATLGWPFGLWPAPRVANAQRDTALAPPDEAVRAGDRVQEVPSGVFDGEDPERIPGILPLEEAPPEVQEKVRALAEARDQAAKAAPEHPRSAKLVPPPDNPDGPPRMDSGDPNPDRVNIEPDAALRGHRLGVRQ